MAEVYLARDTKLGRKAALKAVRPDVLGSPDAVETSFEAATISRSALAASPIPTRDADGDASVAARPAGAR